MAAARRIVVKIGTNTITGGKGPPDPAFLGDVARQVAELKKEGREVLIVTSGAIGAGAEALGLTEKVRELKMRQACAAIGQGRLMARWTAAFEPHGIPVAELLLTYDVFARRATFLHARDTLLALLKLGAVPVINENDAVAVEEIGASFGDNDKLSALVATKLEADLLVVLSDVDGLYTRPPGKPGARRLDLVPAVTDEVRGMAAGRSSAAGRGGMASKVEAAAIATGSGTPMVIARGREPDVLVRLANGEALGTLFVARPRPRNKERWLALTRPAGRILVDAGAAAALRAHKDLLPAGIVGVEGHFDVESVVDIAHGGKPVARAVSPFSSEELRVIKGLKSGEAKRALGVAGNVNVTRKKDVALL